MGIVHERPENIKVIKVGKLKGTKQTKEKELMLLDGKDRIDYSNKK